MYPARFTRASALLGGTGLLLHYALHLLHGVQTNRILWDDMTTPLGRFDGLVFTAAFVAIDAALLGVFAALKRTKQGPFWLLMLGALFATAAIGAELVGILSFFADHMIQAAMAVGCLSMFVSALLLGIAGLLPRREQMPLPALRQAAGLMILFALTTAPLGFAFQAVDNLKTGVPSYVLVEVHFVAAALLWLAIGAKWVSPKHESALRMDATEALPAA